MPGSFVIAESIMAPSIADTTVLAIMEGSAEFRSSPAFTAALPSRWISRIHCLNVERAIALSVEFVKSDSIAMFIPGPGIELPEIAQQKKGNHTQPKKNPLESGSSLIEGRDIRNAPSFFLFAAMD